MFKNFVRSILGKIKRTSYFVSGLYQHPSTVRSIGLICGGSWIVPGIKASKSSRDWAGEFFYF